MFLNEVSVFLYILDILVHNTKEVKWLMSLSLIEPIFLYHSSIIYINASPQMATFQLNKTTEYSVEIPFRNKNLYVESLSLVAITRQNDWLWT